MDRAELQAVQKPLKDRYRDEPAAALITLRADGRLDEEQIACKVDTGRALVEAGLHPATGGTGAFACSGDMLLEALVGRLSVGRDPHPASTHVADVGLMVALDARRQGVGTALLQAAADWARETGICKLELHVFPWNEAAIALYEAFGFEREGYRKRHYRRGDELVDAILMAYEVE